MLPLVTIYLVADVGSVAGGYISSKLIQKVFTVNQARKFTMLFFAISVTPLRRQRRWVHRHHLPRLVLWEA